MEHFDIFLFHITELEARQAREAYASVRGGYRENKVLLSKKDFMKLIYAFWRKYLFPLKEISFPRVIWTMIVKGDYVPGQQWILPSGHFCIRSAG